MSQFLSPRPILDAFFIFVYLVSLIMALATSIQTRPKRAMKALERIYFVLIIASCTCIIPALSLDIAYELSDAKLSHRALTYRFASRFLTDMNLIVLMAVVCQTALTFGDMINNLTFVDENDSGNTTRVNNDMVNEKPNEISLEFIHNQTKSRGILANLLLVVLPCIVALLIIVVDIIVFGFQQKRHDPTTTPHDSCVLESEEKIYRGFSKIGISLISIMASVFIVKFIFDLTTYYMYKFDPEELLRNPEKQAEEARLSRMGILFVLLIILQSLFVGARVIPATINNMKDPMHSCQAYTTTGLVFRYIIAIMGFFQIQIMLWYFRNSTQTFNKKKSLNNLQKQTVEDVLEKYGITPDDLTLTMSSSGEPVHIFTSTMNTNTQNNEQLKSVSENSG